MTWEKTSIIFVTSLCDFDICAFTCHAGPKSTEFAALLVTLVAASPGQ
jgi:hypothetical protein